MHQLHLGIGLRLLPPQQVSWIDLKQSDGEAPVTWEMLSTSTLLLLPGPLWPGVLALDRVLSMGQVELFDT